MAAWIPVIIASVAAIGGIFGTWLTGRMQQAKTDAEATSVLTGIALQLVQPLQVKMEEMQREIQRMERKIVRLEEENALLHKWAQLLFSQVLETGQDPIPFERVQYLNKKD